MKIETIKRKLGKEYELIELGSKTISYKHIECGEITTKTHKSFLDRPNCKNSECVNKKLKEHFLKKYGVENPAKAQVSKDKTKKTNLARYGVESPNSSTEVKERKKAVMLKKYGVENPSHIEGIREKASATMVKKYGVPHASQSEVFKDKMKASFKKNNSFSERTRKVIETNEAKVIKRLSEMNYEFLDKYKGQSKRDKSIHIEFIKYKIKHTKCGTEFMDDVFTMPRCPKCFNIPGKSQLEEKWCIYIEKVLNEKTRKI